MRVALISHNARGGDAIGNQIAEKLAFFRARGAELRLFVEDESSLHPELKALCQVLPQAEWPEETWQFLTGADLVVVEFGQYYPALGLLPHGVAVGLMLPHVVRFNGEVEPAREGYRELLGDPGELAQRIEALRAGARLPGSLRDCGVDAASLPELAEEASHQWTATFNPRPVDAAALLSLYEAAF